MIAQKWDLEGRSARKPVQQRQHRQSDSKSWLKVLDFHSDNDQAGDSNGEYTSATLIGGILPDSFSVCSAYMVQVSCNRGLKCCNT